MSKPPTQKPPAAQGTQRSSQRASPSTLDGESGGLVQLRQGLYLNPVQFVSLRTKPDGNETEFGLLQLSNGDTLTLTKSEFARIVGEEPHASTTTISQEIKGLGTQKRKSEA